MELVTSLGNCLACGASVEGCGNAPQRCCAVCNHADDLARVYGDAFTAARKLALKSLTEHIEVSLRFAESDLAYAWTRVALAAGEVAGIRCVWNPETAASVEQASAETG